MCEVTLGGSMGQEPGLEMEGIYGAQESERMNAEGLSLGVAETTTWTVRMGPLGADELFRAEGRKDVEKFRGNGRGKGPRHREKPTPWIHTGNWRTQSGLVESHSFHNKMFTEQMETPSVTFGAPSNGDGYGR